MSSRCQGHHWLLGSNCGPWVSAPVSAPVSRVMTERIHVKGDGDLTGVLDRPLSQNERTGGDTYSRQFGGRPPWHFLLTTVFPACLPLLIDFLLTKKYIKIRL